MEIILSDEKNNKNRIYTGTAGKVSTTGGWRKWLKLEGKKNRDYYFIYPDKIYVRNYALTDTTSELNSNFSFYFIDTQIASGSDKGKDIKRIQFEFNLVPKGSNQPVDIVKVSPDEKSIDQGTVSKKETVVIKQKADTGGGADTSIPLGIINTKFGASGSLNYDKSKETVSKYDYSPHMIIAQGRGVGTYAIWEFTRDESEPLKGQYAINVYFRIQKPHPALVGIGFYQALPRIILNDKVIEKMDDGQPLLPIEMEFLK
jgi:hypothetical protein